MEIEVEEVKRLENLIKEDNVEGLSNILNSNENLRNNFNTFLSSGQQRIYLPTEGIPLLHFAVMSISQKVLEYLLSQDFVDKTICSYTEENIYHIVCRLRGEEELFSIIERKVPHNLLSQNFDLNVNTLEVACANNNIFIVKRVYEILKSLQLNFTHTKNRSLGWALYNGDIEVIKYVLSISAITNESLLTAIGRFNIEIVVLLMNAYLCQSIPSHLHNHFHIFQFSNHPLFYNNYINNNNNNNNNYNRDEFNAKKKNSKER